MATFTGTPGTDNLVGGTGSDDFRFNPSNLTADDMVDGKGAYNYLTFTGTGTVAASAMANILNINSIQLDAGGVSLVLDNAVLNTIGSATTVGRFLQIRGSSGADNVDASAVTLASLAVFITAGTGNSIFKGGAGDDQFNFGNSIDAGDIVQGNGGSDQLVLSKANAPASTLIGVSGIETFALSGGSNQLYLNDTVYNTNGTAAGAIRTLSVDNYSAYDFIDASAVTLANHAIKFTINGNAGTYTGGAGNDVFVVRTGPDSQTIQGKGGSDTLFIENYTHIQPFFLSGVSGIETINLNSPGVGGFRSLELDNANLNANGIVNGANRTLTVLTSSYMDTVDASDVTLATRAIDVTSAFGGNETFRGGAGNDIFRFHATELNASDIVQGNGGYDTLVLYNPAALSAAALGGVSGIETIRLYYGGTTLSLSDAVLNVNGTVSGADRVLTIVGSSGIDRIDASAVTAVTRGINVIAGAGDDVLVGGNGNDIFEGGVGADSMTGGIGTDIVSYRSALSGVTVSLDNSLVKTGDATGDTFSRIEGLYGSLTGNDHLRGDARNNILDGGGGNDTLQGGNGNDWLIGGDGLDILTGGTGTDTFWFTSPIGPASVDTITDFNPLDDQIRLENTGIFTGLPDGFLAAGAFTTGAAATDTLDRIIYNTATGALYFDVDGSGSAPAVQFAVLTPHLSLSAGNFLVI